MSRSNPLSTMATPRIPATSEQLGDADLAAVGALLADPGRCLILLALDDGRALPAGRLAAEAGVAAATASSHLGKLVAGGLLSVEVHGRHRFYRLADPAVGRLIEVLGQFAPATPVRSLRQGTRAHALRRARTCYDHLAGRLGVDLMAGMIARAQLAGGDGTFDPARARSDQLNGFGHDVDYTLTDDGERLLVDVGIVLPSRRPVVRYCIDWTEQRHHLAGWIGRALLIRFTDLDWVRRSASDRAVQITDSGHDGLAELFGIRADRP